MDPTLETLLTVGGNAVVVVILMQALKALLAWGDAQTKRFGPVMAIGLGVVVAELAAVAVGQSGRDLAQAVLTGLLSGSSAVGVYQVAGQTASAAKSTLGG